MSYFVYTYIDIEQFQCVMHQLLTSLILYTYVKSSWNYRWEKFTGLNVYVFNPIEVFAEILSRCHGQKCLLFNIIIERHLYSWENFRGTLENCEKREFLAQRIFPHLWYDNVMSFEHKLILNYEIITNIIILPIHLCWVDTLNTCT